MTRTVNGTGQMASRIFDKAASKEESFKDDSTRAMTPEIPHKAASWSAEEAPAKPKRVIKTAEAVDRAGRKVSVYVRKPNFPGGTFIDARRRCDVTPTTYGPTSARFRGLHAVDATSARFHAGRRHEDL